jgi:hypothetical protein
MNGRKKMDSEIVYKDMESAPVGACNPYSAREEAFAKGIEQWSDGWRRAAESIFC